MCIRDSHYPGGGGLYIEFTDCTPGMLGEQCIVKDRYPDSNYTIQNCAFLNNKASILGNIYIHPQGPFQGFGRGGGLAIYLNGNTKKCTITIINCRFQNNSAFVGGGIFTLFRGSPSHNSINVKDSDFTTNKVVRRGGGGRFHKTREGGGGAGGGGVGGGFLFSKDKRDPILNSLVFMRCQYVGNSAEGNGGGLSLFSTKGMNSDNIMKNTIKLINCSLSNNHAYVASALDFAPEVYDRLGSGVLPIPVNDNCNFVKNHVVNRDLPRYEKLHHLNTSLSGIATVFISTFQVKFKREIFFKDNEGTALHLSSASVNLTKGSLVHFEGNYGKYGGAVNMIALSVIHVYDECTLKFINNTSVSKGGAFYVHSLDQQHEASFSHSCFMQYRGHTEENTDRNITFLFQNNSALSGLGNVLFAISLLPCDHARHEKRTIFDNIGKVSHQNEGVSGLDITTLVNDFEFSEGTLEQMQHLIPGIEFDMNITSIDELHHNRSSVFNAHMTSREDANITIDPANTLVSNNIINVHGNKIGRVGTLTLETEIASISIKIGLGECPPGYLNVGGSCVCSPSRFLGVARCKNSTTFIFRGYWIGRCDHYIQGKLCSARCPL